MTPLLSVQGITKRYGAHIGCADVSFDLYPGEVMGDRWRKWVRQIHFAKLHGRASDP